MLADHHKLHDPATASDRRREEPRQEPAHSVPQSDPHDVNVAQHQREEKPEDAAAQKGRWEEDAAESALGIERIQVEGEERLAEVENAADGRRPDVSESAELGHELDEGDEGEERRDKGECLQAKKPFGRPRTHEDQDHEQNDHQAEDEQGVVVTRGALVG